jgi:hypothetical protein
MEDHDVYVYATISPRAYADGWGRRISERSDLSINHNTSKEVGMVAEKDNVAKNDSVEKPDMVLHFPDLAKAESTVNMGMCLFLDVATKYTGYSLFEYNGRIKPESFQLVGYGIFKANTKADWESRCLTLSSKIRNIIMTVKPRVLVMEYPSFQGGTKGTAASRSGGTLELAFLCGKIAMAWEGYVGYVAMKSEMKIKLTMPYLITFSQWNGQLTKDITCRRLFEHFRIQADPASIENNFADAIMMGRAWITEKLKVQVMVQHNAERVDL